jgi:hypothetical protein
MYFKNKTKEWLYLLIGMLALPSGYLLLHLETRFIWATSFIFFIAGALLMQQLFQQVQMKKWQRLIIWLFFFGSFLLEPINQLKDQAYGHKSIFDTAEQMKQQQISGSFTSNAKADECMVFAYLTKNPFYAITKPSYYSKELLTEISQYKIRYYFFYYSSQQEKEAFLSGAIAKAAIKQIELEPGLLVFNFY